MKKQYTVTKVKEVASNSWVLKQVYGSVIQPKLLVIMGSDEVIFGKTYVSAIMSNKHIGKFLKSSLDFNKYE